MLILPESLHGFVISKFRGDEVHQISAKKQRLWIEILNKSFEKNLVAKKNSPIGFVIIKPENLPRKHATKKNKKNKISNETSNKKPKKQTSIQGFF